MTKDQLINRVLLLISSMKMALKEGETATATIKDVPLEVLKEAATELGCEMKGPWHFVPYYYAFYYANHGQTNENRNIIVEMRTRVYKEETITKFV